MILWRDEGFTDVTVFADVETVVGGKDDHRVGHQAQGFDSVQQ